MTVKFGFDTITPDDILTDRIIFGDNKVREKPFREPELDLDKTLDICRAAEMSQAQIKAVDDLTSARIKVHQVKETWKEKSPMAPA